MIFTRIADSGRYQSGIQFLAIKEDSLSTLRRYIEAFNALSADY